MPQGKALCSFEGVVFFLFPTCERIRDLAGTRGLSWIGAAKTILRLALDAGNAAR